VPVEALMTENDEIQSIHIGDYATIVSPTDTSACEDQVYAHCDELKCYCCYQFVFVSFSAGRQFPTFEVFAFNI
jgi:hypothetical protein